MFVVQYTVLFKHKCAVNCTACAINSSTVQFIEIFMFLFKSSVNWFYNLTLFSKTILYAIVCLSVLVLIFVFQF